MIARFPGGQVNQQRRVSGAVGDEMQGSELDRLLTNLNVRIEAVAVCEIGRGYSLVFEPQDTVVLHHVVRGCGHLEVQGHQPVPFAAGSMLLVPRRRTKRIRVGGVPSVALPAGEHCSTLPSGLRRLNGAGVAPAEVAIVCGLLHANFAAFTPLDDLSVPVVEDMSASSAVRLSFQTMLTEQAHPTWGTSALTAALMKQCLVLFLRQHFSGTRVSPLSLAFRDERLARALSAILEHPGELRMRELAACAGMSRSAFAKRFVETLHKTPMEFARQTRLHRAAELLEATDFPIKTIAAEAGYASRSQFCRAFRAVFDAHPTSYRKSRRRARTPPSSTAVHGEGHGSTAVSLEASGGEN